MLKKQSVFVQVPKKATNFSVLESSDSEERELKPKFFPNNERKHDFSKMSRTNESIEHTSRNDWEDVRHIKKFGGKVHSHVSFQNNMSNSTSQKKSGEYRKSGSNSQNSQNGNRKIDAMKTHKEQARSTVHGCIESFVKGASLDEIALNFKNAIDSENGHYAKGKLIEICVSHLFHELLAHPLIKQYFFETNVREGDGHTALHWVAWSDYFKYSERFSKDFETGKIDHNPLGGFERNLEDAMIMVDLLFSVKYTPTTKNKQGETAVYSLSKALAEGKIPIDWYEPMKAKYVNITPECAEVTLREICSKVSTDSDVLEKYSTLYCLAFYKSPEFAARLAVEFCMKLTPSCIEKGFWKPVKDKLDMFRRMIISFDDIMHQKKSPQDYIDFRDAFSGWKSNTQLKLFNQRITAYTLDLLDDYRKEQLEKSIAIERRDWRYDTCFMDPLAGVIGECGDNSQTKKYILDKLESISTFHLAMYCLSHSRFMDKDIASAFADICEMEEFTTNLRLKFAFYDVLEKLYKQKFKNIEQCVLFLKSDAFFAPVEIVPTKKINETLEEKEVVQLSEEFCDILRHPTKRVFDGEDESMDDYFGILQGILKKPSTNVQCVLESFISRAFYDVYNEKGLFTLTYLVEKCTKLQVFDSNTVRNALQKLKNVELGDFFESSKLEEVNNILKTL